MIVGESWRPMGFWDNIITHNRIDRLSIRELFKTVQYHRLHIFRVHTGFLFNGYSCFQSVQEEVKASFIKSLP